MKSLSEFKLISLILLSLGARVSATNFEDFFENFECENTRCTVIGISSASGLEDVYKSLQINTFEYYEEDDNCRWYGSDYCVQIRAPFEVYTEVIFVVSKFKKFPTGDFSQLSHIESLSAINVGLSELNRDDFKSFKVLESLDLSENNLTTLGSLVFLHLVSLQRLELRNNQIESIDWVAFHDSNGKLTSVNLSNNKLKEISEKVLTTIGKGDDAELLLHSNAIERIILVGSSSKKVTIKFKFLDLGNNKLKSFNINCSLIDALNLDENQLDEFAISNCTVNFLYLNGNNLSYLSVGNVSALKISNNARLQNLTVPVENLKLLEIKNLPAKILTYDTLKGARKLEHFDAAGTFLGSPKINTFSEMTSLKKLNLSNTGLSHIEYGMFSHQRNVEELDISDNELGSIDINKLASMKGLKVLGIKGNNLTRLEHVDVINKSFTALQEIAVDRNSWNCTYLANLIKNFGEHQIIVSQPITPEKDLANVNGFKCVTEKQEKIQPVDVSTVNEAVSNKLNEIIEQINAEKTARNNHKFDLDVLKSEVFSIQREILDIKTKMVTNQVSAAVNGGKNSSVDMNAIKVMMEQLNNFTLEKQKLAIDQLLVKISELQNQITRHNIEHEYFVQKNQLPEMISKQSESPNYQRVESSHSGDTSVGVIMLTIVVTALVLCACAYGYIKLNRKFINYHQSYLGVRAQSTNTINTTVELPVGNGHR